MTSRHHVIVGDGAAGIAAATTIRKAAPSDRITLISDDRQPGYYRAALTNYLAGELSDDELWALPPDAWEKLKLNRILARVESLDIRQHTILLTGNRRVSYDRLLIASGSRATELPKDQLVRAPKPRNIFPLRSLTDIKTIIERASHSQRALVIGGGILGIEVADGLRRRNLKVTLAVRAKHLLDKVVDERAAELIRWQMEQDKVSVKTSWAVKSIDSTATGERATFKDKSTPPKEHVVESDMIVVCVGTTPNSEWLAGSPVALEKGSVVVDRTMRVTDCSDIWAAGDVALVRDPRVPVANPSGLWQPAQRQGQVAGLNMAASDAQVAEYLPGYLQNSTKAWGIDLSSGGEHVNSPGETPPALESRKDGAIVYKRILIRDGKLAGFMLLGDRREAGAFCRLMNLQENAANIEPIKNRLLDSKFDLFGYIAAQERQGAPRLKGTLFFPSALPASVVATVNRRPAIRPPLPDSVIAESAAPASSLRLVFDGGSIGLSQGGLRVGGAGHDVKIDIPIPFLPPSAGFVEITSAGVAWLASPVGERVPAMVNGVALTRPAFLEDNDRLQMGTWKAIVQLTEKRRLKNPNMDAQSSWELLGLNRFPIRSRVTLIGSSADNHVVIKGPHVSFFHAQLSEAAGGLYIVDAGSKWGTKVNGEDVIVPRKLQSGDILDLGGVKLQLSATTPAVVQDVGRINHSHSGTDCYLVSVEGPMAPRALRLPVPGTIGREEPATVVVNDPLLSRLHAKFEQDGANFFVSDLGSMNGTTVGERKVPSGARYQLQVGNAVCMGSHVFRFETALPSTLVMSEWLPKHAGKRYLGGTLLFRSDTPADIKQQSCELVLVGAPERSMFESVNLQGPGPHVLGGKVQDGVIVVPGQWISRRHAEIAYGPKGWQLTDLGSSNGSFVNGKRLSQSPCTLEDGDEIQLAFSQFQFRTIKLPEAAALQAEAQQGSAGPSRFDNWQPVENPLEADLEKAVREDLDACIGCHVCMRACPLPDAKIVTIAALNGFAAGNTEPSDVVKQFVQDCTQCHACVPVCPANIRRSRIVLFNKLKHVPDADARVVAQIAKGEAQLRLSIGDIATQMRTHELFAMLTHDELLRCASSARTRKLSTGEELFKEGQYIDALWILMSGRLEAGATTQSKAFQRMVTLLPGKHVGEKAVLSDGVSDITVRAAETSLVVGVTKYGLRDLAKRNPQFSAILDNLYLAGTAESALKASARFSALSDAAITRIARTARAERYQVGDLIVKAQPRARSTYVVIRGFVKEIRLREGEEIVRNYWKDGDEFGAMNPHDADAVLRWEAATLCEVLIMDRTTANGGAASSSNPSVVSAPGLPSSLNPPSDGAPDSIMQATQLMVIDTTRCVDCDNCVDACERRHGHSRLDRGGSSQQFKNFLIPGSCYHCKDPVCLLCSVDGIVREPTGEIRIVEDNCIGCEACAERCPYDNIQMVSAKPVKKGLTTLLPLKWRSLLEKVREEAPHAKYDKVAVKCDLCEGFSDGPACVRSCPTGAAQRVDPLTFNWSGSAQ